MLAFHDRGTIVPFFTRTVSNYQGKEYPQSRPPNPHGPFGLWIGISLRARVRPKLLTKEIGCWEFPLESTSTVAGLLLFCFVDLFFKFAHIWKLDGFCMLLLLLFIPCWLWTIRARFCSDAIEQSIVGLFAPVIRIARWKIVRRKAERALSVKTYSKITNFRYF